VGDQLVGTAVADLTTLALGLPEVHGWYHLADGLQVRPSPTQAPN
jgi:hypothetical protein